MASWVAAGVYTPTVRGQYAAARLSLLYAALQRFLMVARSYGMVRRCSWFGSCSGGGGVILTFLRVFLLGWTEDLSRMSVTLRAGGGPVTHGSGRDGSLRHLATDLGGFQQNRRGIIGGGDRFHTVPFHTVFTGRGGIGDAQHARLGALRRSDG